MKVKWVVTLAATACFLIAPQLALAANESSPPLSEGESISQNFFVPPGSSSNIQTLPNGLEMMEVTKNELTPGGSTGAIWSTEANKIDLKQDFYASTYLYFGGGEGMTFVMHNNPSALASTPSRPISRLGVWADPQTNNPKNSGGMEKSLAIEFDLIRSDSAGKKNDGYLDQIDAVVGEHIAWNYPGDAGAYEVAGNKKKLYHKDLKAKLALTNDQWHKFEVKWDASAQKLTYIVDNTAPVTISGNLISKLGSDEVYWGFAGSNSFDYYGSNRVVIETIEHGVDADVSIDLIDQKNGQSVVDGSVLPGTHLTTVVTANLNRGKQGWQHLVATLPVATNFEYQEGSLRVEDQDGKEWPLADPETIEGEVFYLSLPNMNSETNQLTLKYDLKVKGITENKEVQQSASISGKGGTKASSVANLTIMGRPVYFSNELTPSSSEVENNDEQTWSYTVNFLVPLDAVSFKRELSDNLSYIPDSTTLNGQAVPDLVWETVGGGMTNQEELTFTFKTKISGKADDLGQAKITVESKGADGGREEQAMTENQVKLIKTAPVLTLPVAESIVDLSRGTNYLVSGQWLDKESDYADLYYQINQETPIVATRLTQRVTGVQNDFQEILPTSSLPVGIYQLSLYLIDSEGMESEVKTVTLNVYGELVLGDVPDLSFGEIPIPKTVVTMPRPSSTSISIKDSREQGKNWRLTVKLGDTLSSPDGKYKLPGLHYRSGERKEYFIPGEGIVVETGQSQDNPEQIINWEADEGILLEVTPDMYQAKYSAELEWVLEDVLSE